MLDSYTWQIPHERRHISTYKHKGQNITHWVKAVSIARIKLQTTASTVTAILQNANSVTAGLGIISLLPEFPPTNML